MAEALQADRFNAVVAEQHSKHPEWFTSGAKIVGYDTLTPRTGEILVLPEDQPELLRQHLAEWPQRKVVYCQNHFYAAIGALGSASYADFGVSAILCGSVTIQRYCADRHAGLPSHLVPCAIDTHRFKPAAAKTPEIVLIPRKRVVEAVYLQDMFRHRYPQWAQISWQPVLNLPETALAERLGQAAVFLGLSRSIKLRPHTTGGDGGGLRRRWLYRHRRAGICHGTKRLLGGGG